MLELARLLRLGIVQEHVDYPSIVHGSAATVIVRPSSLRRHWCLLFSEPVVCKSSILRRRSNEDSANAAMPCQPLFLAFLRVDLPFVFPTLSHVRRQVPFCRRSFTAFKIWSGRESSSGVDRATSSAPA